MHQLHKTSVHFAPWACAPQSSHLAADSDCSTTPYLDALTRKTSASGRSVLPIQDSRGLSVAPWAHASPIYDPVCSQEAEGRRTSTWPVAEAGPEGTPQTKQYNHDQDGLTEREATDQLDTLGKVVCGEGPLNCKFPQKKPLSPGKRSGDLVTWVDDTNPPGNKPADTLPTDTIDNETVLPEDAGQNSYWIALKNTPQSPAINH